ncbi:uncharacterized protein [Temnothorax longispinosus]|uniref:uncharacterized protein n=1 Tax=Temnothorax longispinosus TaxID=300112 RepID=UPI003A98FEF9
MPKHRDRKDSSPSRRSKGNKAHRKHRSRVYSPVRRSRDLSRHRGRSRSFSADTTRTSRDSSVRGSLSRDSCFHILEQVRKLIADRADVPNLQDPAPEVRSHATDIAPVNEALSVSQTIAPALEQSASTEEQTVAQTDRGVVPGMSSCRPTLFSFIVWQRVGITDCFLLFCFFCLEAPAPTNVGDALSTTPGNVSFADPPSAVIPDSQDTEILSESDALARDLFGGDQAPSTSSAWNPIILNSIQTKARVGLKDDIRTSLLAKYETKADLAALAPPKLNKELRSALTPSVLKRDEYQSLSQAQVGACLNALGSGMSILLKSEIRHKLKDDARSALSFLSEGIHLLSDHHFRLSLARRAFTKLSFNIIGKNAAKTAPIDEFLFGQNFAETLKAAQACEKAGRDVSKSSALVGKKTLQPVRQQAPQRRFQPPTHKSQPPGNRKASVRPATARQTGAPYTRSRHHRSRSHSHSRSRPRYHR